MADLERVLQQLRDSEINAGVQTFYDAGMRVWIGDEMNGIQAETTINRTAAARLKWPEGLTAATWLHETVLRLYPDSKYAKEHSTEARRRPSRRGPPKINALEKTAVRIMRKLYEATGGQPQRWESLGNLGAVASDAASIAYAVERGWLIISGGPALSEPHRGRPVPGEVAAALLE
jgi:hypothetical protein